MQRSPRDPGRRPRLLPIAAAVLLAAAGRAGGQAPPLDPTAAGAEAHLALDIRPPALFRNAEIRRFMDLEPKQRSPVRDAFLAGEIEQVLVIGFDRRPAPPRGDGAVGQVAIILRAAQPRDWKAFIPRAGRDVRADGFTYRVGGEWFLFDSYRVLDDRTLLIGFEAVVRDPPLGAGRPRGPHAWDDAWGRLAAGPVRLAFDKRWLADYLGRSAEMPAVRAFAPLVDRARGYGLTLNFPDGLDLDAVAVADGDDDAAARVAATAAAGVTLLRNSLPALRQLGELDRPAAEPVRAALADALDAMLGGAAVTRDGAAVRLRARSGPALLAAAGRLGWPAAPESPAVEFREAGAKGLKRLGWALLMYYNWNGRLPTSVMLGHDGKTPHSWRVELLPYLGPGEIKLYQQYNTEEPWDGPNNSKLIGQMPPIYGGPGARFGQDRPGFAAYFLPTGPGTLYPAGRPGLETREITGANWSKLLIVEARRPIPWTQPEDIPVPPDGPLPPLGGVYPGGFNAFFLDGTTRFLRQAIDPRVFRALVEPTGTADVRQEDF